MLAAVVLEAQLACVPAVRSRARTRHAAPARAPTPPARHSLQWAIADFDWSNAKAVWANGHPMNCEELLAQQAALVVAASARRGTNTRVFVYRNLVKALPWFTTTREAMTDPSTADAWFLPFKPGGSLPNGTWHVPACDDAYDPPLCSTRYHDRDQTPGYPHGDGSCSAPCDCGGVPCGEVRSGGAARLWRAHKFYIATYRQWGGAQILQTVVWG